MNELLNRKLQHLNLSLDKAVRGNGAELEDVQLPYDALFTVSDDALDTHSVLANIPVDFPLMFGAITGGIEEAASFNTTLRSLAAQFNLPMQLGSIRPLLDHPDLIHTYGTGRVQALCANIGASQTTPDKLSQIARICEKLGASVLCIHLNGLQEWVQDEGNHHFGCDLDTLAAFINRFPLPVIFKEVGSGIGGTGAHKLAGLNIAGLETASRGGTSWIKIEAKRRRKPLSQCAIQALDSIGYDMKQAISSCRLALGPHKTLIASGGIQNSADCIRALFLGADLVAMAQPLWQAWHENKAASLEHFVCEFIDVARLIWRSTGCRSLAALHKVNC